VRIFGEEYKVKAKVVQINGISAHADRNEMLNWLKSFKSPPKQIFLVHGEIESAKAFGAFLEDKPIRRSASLLTAEEIILD